MEKPRGIIKTTPEDFVVEEIPAYEPSGEGEHLFVRFEKKNLTTDAAVQILARELGAEMRNVGIAGMKDKVAVTRQWVSLLLPKKEPALEEKALKIDRTGLRVLEAKRHGNKLKTGHLKGNRFELVVRGIDPAAFDAAKAALEACAKDGVPNAFGPQRFGKHGDTHEQARAWMTGKTRPPQDARLRRLHFSALQSAIFNALLDARVADGTWIVPQEGDILRKEDTGGLFLCTDVQTDRERAAKGELCPTGPILGEKMKQPEGAIRALEERIAAPFIEGIDLHRARALGEGTRRPLRLVVDGLSVAQVMDPTMEPGGEQGSSMRVQFVLPKGAYATTVLSNVFEITEPSGTKTTEEAQSTSEPDTGRAEEE